MSEKIRKSGLASIIKYEGNNETFIWKHPIEDFNYGSQLIVHESQEAVFFKDGQALDTFGPGRYTLETQQLPLLEKAYKLPTDTEGTFHSEIYFINKTVQMAIKWGTPDKVRFIDPLTGTPLDLGASGTMNIQVSNSRKLLVKLVGTNKGIAWEEGPGFTKSLQASFRPMISNAVKTNLPTVIKSEAIDLLEIDEKLDIISANLREKILPGFEEFGLTIPQFYVTNECNGGYVEIQMTSNLLQVRLAYFLDLLVSISEDTSREALRKKIKETIEKDHNDITLLERDSFGKALLKQTPDMIIDIIGECIPGFGGVVKEIAKSVLKAIRHES